MVLSPPAPFPHPHPSLPLVTLQMLYKLKTSKVFEKPKAGEGRGVELMDEDPYAVQMISWCPQSRLFCVVGSSAHVILYRFSRHDATTEITVSGSSTPRLISQRDIFNSIYNGLQ